MLTDLQVKALMIRADAVLRIEDSGMTGLGRLGWVLFPTEAVEVASLTAARQKLDAKAAAEPQALTIAELAERTANAAQAKRRSSFG